MSTDQPVVRIGFAGPLTGPQAIVGVPLRHAAELAVDRFAADVHGAHVELVALDDEATPGPARAVAEHFAADPAVIAVVGHKNSGPCGAAASIYADAGLAFVSPSATDDGLAGGTFFRMCVSNSAQARAAADYATGPLGATRVGTVHDRTEYGEPLVAAFTARAVERGADVPVALGVDVGQTGFDAEVAALLEAGLDAVYTGLTEIEDAVLVPALRAAGFEGAFLGAEGGPTSAFVELAGSASEGTIHTYAGRDPGATTAGREFVAAYEAAYGPCPGYGAESYDATTAVLRALGHGARTRAELLMALRGGNLGEGVTGPLRFDARGERVDAAVSLWSVRDGRMLPIPTAG